MGRTLERWCGVATVTAGTLLLAGALLPWDTIGDPSASPYDAAGFPTLTGQAFRAGRITLFLGVALIALGTAALSIPDLPAWVDVIPAAIGAGVIIMLIAHMSDHAMDQLLDSLELPTAAARGLGYWTALCGGILAIVSSVFAVVAFVKARGETVSAGSEVAKGEPLV